MLTFVSLAGWIVVITVSELFLLPQIANSFLPKKASPSNAENTKAAPLHWMRLDGWPNNTIEHTTEKNLRTVVVIEFANEPNDETIV